MDWKDECLFQNLLKELSWILMDKNHQIKRNDFYVLNTFFLHLNESLDRLLAMVS